MRAMHGTEGKAYTMLLARRKLEVLRNNLRGVRQFVVNGWGQRRPGHDSLCQGCGASERLVLSEAKKGDRHVL